jgi:hypothetical protein
LCERHRNRSKTASNRMLMPHWRRPSACVHGVIFSGYRVAASVHGVADSDHGVAESGYGVADSVHGVAASVHGVADSVHRVADSVDGLHTSVHGLHTSGHGVAAPGRRVTDRGCRRAAFSAVLMWLHRYVGGIKKGRILSETALFYRVRKLIYLLMPSRTPQCSGRYRSNSCRHGRCPRGPLEARTWRRPRREAGRLPSRGCRRGSSPS